MPDDGQNQVKWLRGAMPYINRHRGKTAVVCIDGNTFNSENFKSTIQDLGLINCLGLHLVVVFGTRPKIEQYISQIGEKSNYHNGIRVTTESQIQAVKAAAGDAKIEIESILSTGLNHSPLSGARLKVASGNFVTAKPYGIRDGVDFQYTGDIRRVDAENLCDLLDLNHIVLISPTGYSPSGEVFNLSAIDLAKVISEELYADKLIYITSSNVTTPSNLTCLEAESIASKTNCRILQNCADAVRNDVERAHIVSACANGGLLLELFTREGAGTLVTAQNYEVTSPASTDDVPDIIDLISPLEESGVLVKRPREKLEQEIGRFTVIRRDETIIGCAAFYPYVEDHIAELACVVIAAEYQGSKRAEKLLHTLEKSAKTLGINKLFVLTTQTAHWFVEQGFEEGSIDDLPMAKRSLYNYQRNSKALYKNI